MNGSDDFEATETNCQNQTTATSKTLKEKLHLTIQTKLNSPTRPVPSKRDLLSSIKQEIAYFKTSGMRDKYLEKAFRILHTIRPTSVESERAFSVTSLLCTRIRSRLGDKSLDTLAFLRAYFVKTDS